MVKTHSRVVVSPLTERESPCALVVFSERISKLRSTFCDAFMFIDIEIYIATAVLAHICYCELELCLKYFPVFTVVLVIIMNHILFFLVILTYILFITTSTSTTAVMK